MDSLSYLANGHTSVIEDLYQQYLQQKDSVDLGWQKFFEGFDFAQQKYPMLPENGSGSGVEVPEKVKKEFAVLNLIK